MVPVAPAITYLNTRTRPRGPSLAHSQELRHNKAKSVPDERLKMNVSKELENTAENNQA